MEKSGKFHIYMKRYLCPLSQKDRIWHIIPHMRRMFLKIEYSDPEHEAAKLHREDIIQFRNKVRECVDFRLLLIITGPVLKMVYS